MEQDAEAAGAASLGALTAGTQHTVEAGAACKNCGAIVTERFCTRCGQLGADFQRPIWTLVTSSLSDMFALDGRIWRTLPMLMLRPGRLTRNYLDGQRARFVPPFRLFLLTSVIFFLVVFGVIARQSGSDALRFDFSEMSSGSISLGGDASLSLTPPERLADLRGKLADPTLTDEARKELIESIAAAESTNAMQSLMQPDGKIDRAALNALIEEQNGATASPADLAAIKAMSNQMATVYENQERFGARMKEWAPRFTLLFLPVLSLLLALTYCWRRQFFLYDHLIAGLHFQTFAYAAITFLLLVGSVIPSVMPVLLPVSVFIMFAYLFRMLRVVYGTGHILSALRAGVLILLAIVILSLLAVGLVVLSFFLT